MLKNLKRLWWNLYFLYRYCDLWKMDQDVEDCQIRTCLMEARIYPEIFGDKD